MKNKTNRTLRKILSIALCLTLVMSYVPMVSITASAAATDITATIDTGASVTLRDADGDDYYDIGTADELYAFAAEVDLGKYDINGELTADIVLNENLADMVNVAEDGTVSADASVRKWTPLGGAGGCEYKGTFDGGNHTITGLCSVEGESTYGGLIEWLDSEGTVKNLKIRDFCLEGNYSGAIAGQNNGKIIGCSISGTGIFNGSPELYGGQFGGIVFENLGQVTDCSISANLSLKGAGEFGGIAHTNYYGTVTGCSNSGTLTGTEYVGGIVSSNYGTVTGCSNSGTVTGTYYVGGIAGYTDGTVSGCYNTGTVSGNATGDYSDAYVGGIAGDCCGTVSGCYNIGSIDSGTYSGGIAAIAYDGTYDDCYYLDTCVKSGNFENSSTDGITAMSVDQFASGEVAYLLNGDQSTITYRQTLGTDAYPGFTGGTVYQVENCKEEPVYSNTNENIGHQWVNGTCTVCDLVCGHSGGTTKPTDNGNGTHGYDCTVCGTAVTGEHTMDITTGKCGECGADMTAIATVTDGTNTYYASDAATLNQAVTAILETGSSAFTVELPADAEAGMITAIRRAICDTEGVADGSLHLTLKGVTTIPGTTNWDGVAFGPGDIYDEAGKIVDQELVTQLASINLPDVTEIGAQAFYFCENLVTVSAPKAQTIGAQAFGYTALTSVEFPELTTIPTDMFSGTWTLSSAKFPKVTTIEQGGLLVGAKFTPENNPTPFPLELTAEGNITFNGSNHFNIASQNYSGKVDLVLWCDKKDAVTFHDDGTATWQVREDLSYTFKSITFKHSYVDGKCTACGEDCAHTGGTATCTTLAVCDTCGVSYGEVDTTNHDETVAFSDNGFCPNGCYEPATLNAEGYYEIDNAGQLFWFANYINTVDRTANAVLTADIDLENRPWTPIGSTGENSHNFRGTFDGQNHTIKGLYVEGGRAGLGFFGEVRTGTVKNFTIYGEVVTNTEVNYIGGVIGSACGLNGDNDLERNGAIIQNITSYVNLTAKTHGIGMIGGFVGYANHESLIENCSWYGTFDAGEYRVDSGAGGFIGKIQENTSAVTIRNCGAYGTIKTNYVKNSYNNTPTIYMGGFLSFSNTKAQTVLENCLFAGKFERGENLTDEARLGAFGTLRSVNAIKNCYYLGDDGLEAVHSDSPLNAGSENIKITSVTIEQLKSGEVAYLLQQGNTQQIWGQMSNTEGSLPIITDNELYKVVTVGETGNYSVANVGDTNGDGTVDVIDYQALVNKALADDHEQIETASYDDIVKYDLDGDGYLDVIDAYLLHLFINGFTTVDVYAVGDYDLNGKAFEEADIKAIKHAIENPEKLATYKKYASDINGDGKVSYDDLNTLTSMFPLYFVGEA